MKSSDRAPLGAIADIQLGKMLSPGSKQAVISFPYLRNQNIQWDRVDLSDIATMGFDGEERDKFLLRPGDLLVCEGGEPGRAAVWHGELTECFYQKALHRVRPRTGFDAEYLMFALWYLSDKGEFADLNSRTTIAHLPLVRLKALQVPVRSHPEQLALVDIVRRQFSEVANAATSCEEQVSVASGRLSRALLVRQFGAEPVLSVGAPTKSPRHGWRAHRLRDLARLESGHTPSRRRSEWWGGSVPWLALPDIRRLNGKIAYETAENTNHDGLANSSARLLPVNTVCLSRTASIGFVTLLGRPMATSQDFANWICDSSKLDPEFLMFAFMASQEYLRELGSGSVHKTIYMPTIESLHVCAPQIEDQRVIARTLRDQLSAAEELAAGLKERFINISSLPRRLLASAFEQTE